MGDSLDVVLEFLRKNRFMKAEAALRTELSGRPDLDGSSEESVSKEKDASSSWQLPAGSRSGEISEEFIVKEIEVGRTGNGLENKKSSTDLYPRKSGTISSTLCSVAKDSSTVSNKLSELSISEQQKYWSGQAVTEIKKSTIGTKPPLGGNRQASGSKDQYMDNPWSKREEPAKELSVKTVFPSPSSYASTSYDATLSNCDDQHEKKKSEKSNVTEVTKEQLDDVVLDQMNLRSFDMALIGENHREELPRLPPVRLKSVDKLVNMNWEEKTEHHGSGTKPCTAEDAFLIGSFLDVPFGQELQSTGGKRTGGSGWLSVSQGITEDACDLVFATLGDDSVDYPNEYWDSDEYDGDDDVGYMRQPIEDETWFLAHEIDYPSDNEKGTAHGSVPEQQYQVPRKDEDDDQSFAEEDSYLSGEHFFPGKNIHQVVENDTIAQYDGQLLDVEELNLMRAEPVWQGFVTKNNDLVILGNGKVVNGCDRAQADDLVIDDDQHGSVRSIGVGINSDAADFGSEVRESLLGGSSEGDIEYFHDHGVGISGRKQFEHEASMSNFNRPKRDKGKKSKHTPDKYILAPDKSNCLQGMSYTDAGFSFPPPQSKGDLLEAVSDDVTDECEKGLGAEDMLANWRRKSSDSSPIRSSRDEKNYDATRSRGSTPSSASNYAYAGREGLKKDQADKANDLREADPGTTLEDEEVAALQEQIRQLKAQEEEFETFNLKIVHRKNRTGFEEDKNFHVVLNSVIAGRYHVTEYLGSAAFSKAIQAHDLHTGMDVCMKIIKNNKDFFDQSLDEIKLLKYVNKHDPGDKYHILRLYDYFYYREHLLIVCELLKANLYEFHKFNRESGGEVYFTMPRLQVSITIQCLEALQYLHGLGLIHCDLKPENILVKSYSRCEVKVIDLGSSCFQTDHLCSYVQSRSYRAPEVILGLPYDEKIDIWSLGCILAELCTGNVLFQNDSPATLLARVIGIISPIDQAMLAKGKDTYKYFTKNHMLYERNQETSRLEYLIPKKTSLRHRLPMGDQGFIDFVAHLLEINPKKRPSASEALKHPWLTYPYEPISS
ncbi:uncharacterized protein M6B38_274100 [Iris pallida]|uniref:Protein kinase domain-containing protein n=1 Tax=Iris pallida TaxID=29817 RepID=A0AAX6I7H8_IRIPA|nr:uncharacterized protein M6B38_274100 [Iris pallida]